MIVKEGWNDKNGGEFSATLKSCLDTSKEHSAQILAGEASRSTPVWFSYILRKQYPVTWYNERIVTTKIRY